MDTGTDNMLGELKIIRTNLPEQMAKQTAKVLQKTYEETLLEATNEKLKNKASGSLPFEYSSDWEDEEFQDGTQVDAADDVSGLLLALQFSSRIPILKDKARSITIDKKGKKVDEGGSAATQVNAAYGQKGQTELKSTIAMHPKQEASGHPKTTSAMAAGPAPKGGDFETSKKPMPETIKPVGRKAAKIASTSSAAILREEVQRLAAANPSMVSTMQPNPTQQSKKRGAPGGTKSQSVLAKPADKASSIKDAQTAATQPKQGQNASRPSTQLKPGSSSTSLAAAVVNPLLGNEPNQSPISAPSPMWYFTGRSGGPPTPNPPPQTQCANPTQPPAPVPTTPHYGYSDAEFVYSYATYRYNSIEAMADYMDRSLLHSCRRRDCVQAPGLQADGTFRFYRPPPVLTFQRPYGPGLAEGATPPRRRQEGRRINYYDNNN